MIVKNRSISHLIEDQLPEFIVTDYPIFARFLEKYYEQIESRGQPYDILNNLEKYKDIDFYEESLLKESSQLVGIISNTDSTIEVEDASSFPEKNGYIKIDNEICFYKKKEGNTFYEVSRGVSGNTKLGDLYKESTFVTTQAESHSGTLVYNISNLFLYALVKNFETDYLDPFPEKYLKKEIDKRTLIKNISNFYKVKGTESSIKFIFNTIVARDSENVPTTYNPKDFTLKASTSDWSTSYSLKAKILGGNPQGLIGNRITQNNADLGFASAVVDNVRPVGGANGENIYQIILNESTINGSFRIASRTELEKDISSVSNTGDFITVQSTSGWGRFGSFIINNETFTFNDKNVKQFKITGRSGSSTHAAGTPVYDYSPAVYRDYEIIIFGVLYDLEPSVKLPYSLPGDVIQMTSPGFTTKDRIIYDNADESIRWKINLNNVASTALTNSNLQSQLQKYIADVSAIYEDDQFYYICSSGYPTYDILKSSDSGTLSDAKNLKIIRKTPIQTTEVYETTNTSVGVFVDGTIAYSYKDSDLVKYGVIQSINVTQKGSGYKAAPYVLINNQPGKARAFLDGETIGRIDILDDTEYNSDPEVTITSGRNAVVDAIVTNGKITSLVIKNPGEYYSSPPIIRITDRSGKGRFASFNAIISNDGKIIDFERIETGRLYTQEFVKVEVIAEGNFARAEASIRKWVKNRYNNGQSLLDSSNGRLFDNPFTAGEKSYGIVANPKKLRLDLSDNIDSSFAETSNLKHSPILGYAYDGNPIYGPYGYENPEDSSSSIKRISSGYTLKTSRPNGPSIANYPLGSFIDDYIWTKTEKTGKTELDENNGRYCVTPEYPEGTYAYFISIDASNNPVYPYILGENYYSLPVASNYDETINQDDLPTNVKRLNVSNTLDSNGYNTIAKIRSTTRGSVSGVFIGNNPEIFSVGSLVYVNDRSTKGNGVYATVKEVSGRKVSTVESVQTKSIKIDTIQPIYFFDGDIVTQGSSTGEVVGNSFNGNEFLLRNVSGSFNTDSKISSNRSIINVIVDKESNYTKDSTISLFDGVDSIIATASVLEDTVNQNSVKLEVISGSFIVDPEYSLVSDTLSDTSGSKVLSVISLSQDVDIFSINDKIVSIKTEDNHNLAVNDIVNVSVVPDDTTTETTFYVRKKRFQQVKLRTPVFSSTIEDTGIGRIDTLVAGTDYASSTYGGGTFNNVEIVFTNPDFARNSIGQIVGSQLNSGAVLGNEGAEKNAKATVVVGFTKTVTNSVISTSTITVDNLDNIFVGQNVKGQNIAANSIVSSIDKSNNTVTLSNNQTTSIITGSLSSVVFNPGIISSVTVTDKGSAYRKGDLISFVNDDLDKGNLAITRDYIGIVDHVGFSVSNSNLFLTDVRGLSNDDLLQIGSEIVKVTSVNLNNNSVNVLRSQNNTTINDHFNGSLVKLIESKYRFSKGSRITGNTNSDPFVSDYDYKNQILTVYFEYSQSSLNELELSSVFNDESTPSKNVGIDSLEYIKNKFEYSEDNSNFIPLSTLDLQNYYQYKFITEHSSMTDTYLEFSPSINKNIIALDSYRSNVAPGNAGSYVTLKPGSNFGYQSGITNISDTDTISNISVINQNPTYQSKYSRYYFFDKNNDVDVSDGYFNIVPDPLQGEKSVIFKTDDVFVYEYDKEPQYDGSGQISYFTNGKSAIGKAHSIKVENVGQGYDIIPSVIGIAPNVSKLATLNLTYDDINNRITNVSVENSGSDYVKPKAIVIGNGLKAEIDLAVRNGKIVNAFIKNSGFNYTEKPKVVVVETDVNCYMYSTDIGIPESVEVTSSGFLFNNDNTHIRRYFSNTQLLLSDFVSERAFSVGEKITLTYNNIEYATGIVAKNGWREGTNILRLESVKGQFIKGLTIKGSAKGNTAKIVDIFRSEFTPNIKSFYDNIGFYTSDRGRISQYTQKITDSYFYQDYSYVIKSKTPINVWRDLILQTTHPAGFKVFGEVIVTSEQKSSMTKGSAVSFTKIDLNVPQFSSHNQFRTITSSFVNLNNVDEQYGAGTVYVNAQNNSETFATEVIIKDPFDGVIDPLTGTVSGTKTFALTDKATDLPITPYNEQQLIVTLDGVVQEPGVAYTVSGSNITFSTAPRGQYIEESQTIPAQKFYCRSFRFKNNDLNSQYLKKIRNFFQRSGRWLDAANQIKFNKDFIVEETIGYAIENYPNVSWNIFEQKCTRDIRYILDAIEHDLRFGGNTKIHQAGSAYYGSSSSLNHINNELAESIGAFKYAAKLAAASIRNWDYTVTNAVITGGTNVITVPDTFGIVVGMNVSSGSQFPENTYVTEIINDTQIRVSRLARDGTGVPTLVVASGTTFTVTEDSQYAGVAVEDTGNLEVGVVGGGAVSLSSVYGVAGIPQVTFSLSKINNGTFYDASNLIEKNKLYIQEETLGWVKAEYPSLVIPDETKCKRDTGYLVDAVVYSLRYGGTQKIVNFAKAYYDGNNLKWINNELVESVAAFNYAVSLMVLAMRGQLTPGTYTSESPYYDTNILDDPNQYFPACAEVESALNSYAGIVDTLLSEGIGLIQPEPENNQRSGYWTTRRTYSNYNLIPDPLLLASECNNVIESIKTLDGVLSDILNNGPNSVSVTPPDYIDGENTDFELYYENGDIVKTAPSEDLLVFINGVVQLYDSYDIIRSEDPSVTDIISFSEAPRWEQEENVLTVQEPLAVDKTFIIRTGSYEKAIIDSDLVRIKGTGPFPIYDSETGEIKYIDDDRYAYVFVDGVFQRRGDSYIQSGSTITFKKPLVSTTLEDGTEVAQRVDILVLYGRDLDQKLTFFDFEPETYFNEVTLSLTETSPNPPYPVTADLSIWFNKNITRSNAYVYELISGSVNNFQILGNIKYMYFDQDNVSNIVMTTRFNLSQIQPDSIIIISDAPYGMSSPTWYNVLQQYNNPLLRTINFRSYTLSSDLTASFTYYTDSNDDDARNLKRDAIPFFYRINGGSRKYWDEKSGPLVNLRPGDKIKIDGEKNYRNIVSIPDFAKTKEYRIGKEVPNEIYTELTATGYNGISEGQGLAAVAELDENGGIKKLVWNKRNIELFVENNYKDKQTAYGYDSAPFLEFVPRDENGGGAKAEVLVVDGNVIDVYITNPGSGYTQPPQVLTTRGYTRIKEKKISYGITFKFVITAEARVLFSGSEVTILAGGVQPEVYSSFEVLQSPNEEGTSRLITSQLNPFIEPYDKFSFLRFLTSLWTTASSEKKMPEAPEDSFTTISDVINLEEIITINVDNTYRRITGEINQYIQPYNEFNFRRFITSGWTTSTAKEMPEVPEDSFTTIFGVINLEETITINVDNTYRLITQEIYPYIEPYNEFNFRRFITSNLITTSENKMSEDSFTEVWSSVKPAVVDTAIATENTNRIIAREINPYIEPYNEFNFRRFITSKWTSASENKMSEDSFIEVWSSVKPVVVDTAFAAENTNLFITREISQYFVYNFKINPFITSNLTTTSENKMSEDSFIEVWSSVKPEVNNSEIISIDREIFGVSNHGIVDYKNQTDLIGNNYAQGVNGSSVTVLGNWLVGNTYGSIDVHPELTIGNFTNYFPTIVIEDFENQISTLTDLSGESYNYGIPTYQDYATILTSPMSISADFAYILSTERFPESGELLIGKEIISYSIKEPHRVLGVIRGLYGTEITEHSAGDYLRLINNFI